MADQGPQGPDRAQVIADAEKFLRLLLSPCGALTNDDHAWRKCPRCLALHQLEVRHEKATQLIAAAADLLSAPAPPAPDLAALRKEITRIVAEMRNERSRYKSHDLGYVDSVASNRVDDWADELVEVLALLDAREKRGSRG